MKKQFVKAHEGLTTTCCFEAQFGAKRAPTLALQGKAILAPKNEPRNQISVPRTDPFLRPQNRNPKSVPINFLNRDSKSGTQICGPKTGPPFSEIWHREGAQVCSRKGAESAPKSPQNLNRTRAPTHTNTQAHTHILRHCKNPTPAHMSFYTSRSNHKPTPTNPNTQSKPWPCLSTNASPKPVVSCMGSRTETC